MRHKLHELLIFQHEDREIIFPIRKPWDNPVNPEHILVSSVPCLVASCLAGRDHPSNVKLFEHHSEVTIICLTHS